jgi:CHAT domain-containing protein
MLRNWILVAAMATLSSNAISARYPQEGKGKQNNETAIGPTAQETEWEKRYREISDRVVELEREYGELRDKLKITKELPPEEKNRMDQLGADLEVARKEFRKVLDQVYVEFGKGVQGSAKVTDIKEHQTIKNALRELGPGVVALYTIVGDDKYLVLLQTRDTEIRREYKIKREELNHLVFEFREILDEPPSKNREIDLRPLAQKLYQIVIGPIVKDLERAKAQTLMWSLDGVLRYVPIAALYDGQQYMVERYRNVIITPATMAYLTYVPSQRWHVLGLGVSKRMGRFRAMPAVAEELRGIVKDQNDSNTKGLLPGKLLLDEAFTAQSMKAELLKHEYNVVHIASFFEFRPQMRDSFLLLGDGSHLTLEEIAGSAGLFEGVDLLTISGGISGGIVMGDVAANGIELEGLGNVAQRQGARSVIECLWPGGDRSTSQLMQEFYRLRQSQPQLTKAEALRQAQLKLLRSDKYDDPYFWAPFILIGNWR